MYTLLTIHSAFVRTVISARVLAYCNVMLLRFKAAMILRAWGLFVCMVGRVGKVVLITTARHRSDSIASALALPVPSQPEPGG